MRKLRKFIDNVLPVCGVGVILGAVLFMQEIRGQVTVVMLGIFMIQIGVWKLSTQFLPSDRQYNALRTEGDQFLGLIRQLNATALAVKAEDVPENLQAFEAAQEAMRQAVERMAKVAGRTDEELAIEAMTVGNGQTDAERAAERQVSV